MIKAINVTNHKNNSLYLELADPYKTGIAIKSITGLGPNKADINATEYASSDGSMYNSSYVNNRNIVFMFQLLEDPETCLVEDTRHRVYKYFPLKKKITIAIDTDSRTYAIDGYVESVEPDIFQKEEVLQVSVICVNPWFIGNTKTYVYNGPDIDIIYNRDIKTLNFILGDNVIDYEGDVETGVRIIMNILSNTSEKVTVANTTTDEAMEFDMAKIGAMIEASQNIPGNIVHSRQSFIYNNKLHIVVDGQTIYRYDDVGWTYIRTLDRVHNADFVCLGNVLYIFDYNSNVGYLVDLSVENRQKQFEHDTYYESNSSCCVLNNKVYTFNQTEAERIEVNAQWDMILIAAISYKYNLTNIKAITMNNEAHIFGKADYNENVSDGLSISSDMSTVTPVSYYETPYNYQYTYSRPYYEWEDNNDYMYTPISYSGDLYILGGPNSEMFKLINGTWTRIGNLPAAERGIVAATVYANEIWYMTQAIGTCYNYIYSYNGIAWSSRGSLNMPQLFGRSHNDEEWHTSVFGNGDIRVVLAATANALHAFAYPKEHNGNRAWTYAFEYNGTSWYPDGTFAATDTEHPFSYNYASDAYVNNQIGMHVIGNNIYAVYTDNEHSYHDLHVSMAQESDTQWRYMGSDFTEVARVDDSVFRLTDCAEPLLVKSAVLNGDIYIMVYDGDIHTYNPTYPISAGIYKLNGSVFTKVVSIPSVYTFKGFLAHNGSLVVLDLYHQNHITNKRCHIKYDTASFIEDTDVRWDLDDSYDLAVYNNELNILNYPNYHYKLSNNDWVYASTLPYNFYRTTIASIDGELHMIGAADNPNMHYKWNGIKWNRNVYSGVHAGDVLLISTIFGNKYALAIRNNTEYNILSAVAKNIDWLHLEEDDNVIDVDKTESVDVSIQYPVLYKGV